MIKLLLFQRGKKSLHMSVIIAAASAAHTLHNLVVPERFAELLAGELPAPIGVQDQTLCFGAAAGILQGLGAQLCPHIVIHAEALDAAIEAVQHCSQIELTIRARYAYAPDHASHIAYLR